MLCDTAVQDATKNASLDGSGVVWTATQSDINQLPHDVSNVRPVINKHRCTFRGTYRSSGAVTFPRYCRISTRKTGACELTRFLERAPRLPSHGASVTSRAPPSTIAPFRRTVRRSRPGIETRRATLYCRVIYVRSFV